MIKYLVANEDNKQVINNARIVSLQKAIQLYSVCGGGGGSQYQ